MLKLGIALIFLSTLIFVVAMVVPDTMKPLAPLFCQSGEQLTNKQYTYSRPGKTTTTDTFACEDAHGNQRDITGSVTGAAIIGFMILLFAGIALTAIGSNRAMKKTRTSVNNYVLPTLDPDGPPRRTLTFRAMQGSSNDSGTGLQNGVIRFGGQEIHVDDLKSGNYQMNGGKHTLADTLHQLKDAHDQGLLDSDEYGRLRQEALDKLV